MRVIGLTGSIAMGKSTAANAFRNLGLPVFDSDAAVHALYGKGGGAVQHLAKLVPQAIAEGAVDRHALSAAIRQKPELLGEVEKAVHPSCGRRRKISSRNAKPKARIWLCLIFHSYLKPAATAKLTSSSL